MLSECKKNMLMRESNEQNGLYHFKEWHSKLVHIGVERVPVALRKLVGVPNKNQRRKFSLCSVHRIKVTPAPQCKTIKFFKSLNRQ